MVVGCDSDPNAGGKGPTSTDAGAEGGGRGFLDPAAVAELEALGYGRFRGKALVTEEIPASEFWPARVTFDPASGPICMEGEPYSAYYLDRESDDLAIFLDGGGACWTGMCNANPTVDPLVSSYTETWAYSPEWLGLASPLSLGSFRNFQDWSFVSAPYCDGSVFSGRGEVGKRYHHGRQNLAAALDLATRHFPNPRRIVLAGFSAGGYGTIAATLEVRLLYPNARIYVLNDSGPGLFNAEAREDIETRNQEWDLPELIPESCNRCQGGDSSMTELVLWTLEKDAQIKVTFASYTQDYVIPQFLRVTQHDYEALLLRVTGEMHQAWPGRFRRFLVGGMEHVLGPFATGDDRSLASSVVAMTDEDDAGWADLVADGPVLCAHPDAATCGAAAGCRTLSARSAAGDDEPFAGCIAASRSCEARETCAIDVNYTGCHTFPDSCIPNGWSPADCDRPGCRDRPLVAALPDCKMETVIDYLADGTPLEACGDVPVGGDPADARRCALDAQASGRSFSASVNRVASAEELRALNDVSRVKRIPYTDARYQNAVLGRSEEGRVRAYLLESVKPSQHPDDDISPQTYWSACGTSSTFAPCDDEDGPGCVLECAVEPGIECSCEYGPFGADVIVGVTCGRAMGK